MDDFLDYEITLQGFTVTIMSSEDPDVFHVELAESGNQVYDTDIPVNMEAEEGEDIFVEDVINYAAQAAIDIFEAERGTLGQGAGATMAKKKASLWEISELEEWFCKFRGTGFEEEAANLMEQRLGIQLEAAFAEDPTAALYTEQAKVEYEMAMLNLERLKESINKTVIIIQSKKAYYDLSDTEKLEEYLCKFTGDKREDQALSLVQEYLDIQQQLNSVNSNKDDFWVREQEIDDLMRNLSLQLLQQNVIEVQPTEGAEALPNMAADMAELMEGVSLDVPFGEMAARKAQLEAEEMGEMREGLDPAEIPEEKRITWGEGEHVKLKKDVVQQLMGGMTKTFPKGTKITIDSLYDRHGDRYMVRTIDKGKLFKVKWDDLEK